MKTILLCLGVTLVLAGQPGRQRPGVPQQSQPAPTKPEDRCTVEGLVINGATGQPLGKVAVTLRRVDSPPGAPGSARTYAASSDASGAFHIPGVEPGKYRLSATRTGFVSAEYGARDFMQSGTTLTLEARQRLGDLQFRMTPNGVIAGRIVDEDGEPMAYLQVEAMRSRYSQGRKQLVAYGSASTNDLGEYRIFGLPPGRYFVSVSPRRNYAFRGGSGVAQPPSDEEYVATYYPGSADLAAASPLDVSAGTQLRGIDLTLSKHRTMRVKGSVTDASGTEGRRVTVLLMPRGLASFSSTSRSSGIDASGNFEIRGVVPGAYTLVAAKQERGRSLTGRLPLDVGNSNLENLRITINPPVSLSGRVRVDGQATASLSAIQLSLRPRDPGGAMFGSGNVTAKVKEDGSFSLSNVSPDEYRLTLSAVPDGFYVKAILAGGQDVLLPGLDLSRGVPGPLDVVLSPNAGQASGMVQNDQQQAAAGATVVLVPQEKERGDLVQYYKTAITDASGAFSLKNLDPGQYKVYAWEQVEAGAYMDPEFMKPVENRGESLTIREGGQETLQLKLVR
jgi:hypothetical protein